MKKYYGSNFTIERLQIKCLGPIGYLDRVLPLGTNASVSI